MLQSTMIYIFNIYKSERAFISFERTKRIEDMDRRHILLLSFSLSSGSFLVMKNWSSYLIVGDTISILSKYVESRTLKHRS